MNDVIALDSAVVPVPLDAALADAAAGPAMPAFALATFQRLYRTMTRRAHVDVPALRGTHEEWKAWMAAAVAEDFRPSPQLIQANEQLAAWESVLGVGRVSSFPVTVSLALTEVCNARCSFCAYVPERVATERVTLADLQRADWLKFCKTFTPNGGGLGEPFAHPEIVELLNAIRVMAPFIKISIISNGSLLRPDAVRAVTGFVDVLKISLNAATEATYEATMSPLSWSRTLSNVRAVRDEKLRQNTHLPVLRAGFVLHLDNLDELPLFPALVDELGFEQVLVNVMYPPLPIPNRELMTSRHSIFNDTERARARIAAMEEDCAGRGLRLVKLLPVL